MRKLIDLSSGAMEALQHEATKKNTNTKALIESLVYSFLGIGQPIKETKRGRPKGSTNKRKPVKDKPRKVRPEREQPPKATIPRRTAKVEPLKEQPEENDPKLEDLNVVGRAGIDEE